jgi:cation diffusion facilitator CzcD-associated flavoprotein CzcO
MSPATKDQIGNRVAVVGTGVLGLVALKNLKEQGLDVIAFERNDHIGGTWHISGKLGQTTAMSMTTTNTSKQGVRLIAILMCILFPGLIIIQTELLYRFSYARWCV